MNGTPWLQCHAVNQSRTECKLSMRGSFGKEQEAEKAFVLEMLAALLILPATSAMVHCGEDGVGALGGSETGRSSNCSDDAELRRAQPQAGGMAGHCKRKTLLLDGSSLRFDGRLACRAVVRASGAAPGRCHTHTTKMQKIIEHTWLFQLAVAVSASVASVVRRVELSCVHVSQDANEHVSCSG